jgi:hypothetical protein
MLFGVLVVVMMVVVMPAATLVGSTLGIEGRESGVAVSAQSRHHIGDDMIVADAQRAPTWASN